MRISISSTPEAERDAGAALLRAGSRLVARRSPAATIAVAGGARRITRSRVAAARRRRRADAVRRHRRRICGHARRASTATAPSCASIASIRVERESPLAVTLAQAIAANDAMDYAMRKAVELGVTAIQPLVTARSAPLPAGERGEKRLAHWRGVVVAACEQCGRNRIPDVAAPRGAGRLARRVEGRGHRARCRRRRRRSRRIAPPRRRSR